MNQYNTKKCWIVALVILIIAGLVWCYTAFRNDSGQNISSEPTGPNTSTVPADEMITLALGASGTVGPLTIQPLRMVEDSRCPANANCIWAGRARVEVKVIMRDGAPETAILSTEPAGSGGIAPNELTIENMHVLLTEVTPQPIAGAPTQPSEYRITFSVGYNAGINE